MSVTASPCHTCHTSLVWAISPAGKRLPLDFAPVASIEAAQAFKVLYRLNETTGATEAVTPVEYVDAFADRERLHASHFATCTHPEYHSKSGAR